MGNLISNIIVGFVCFILGCLHSDSKKRIPSDQPEIIHCKDCKHNAPNSKYGCTVFHYSGYDTHEMTPDDFCSRGERKM